MQLSISGQNLDVTEALRAHVHEKMEKIVRHFDHLTQVQVVLHVEHGKHVAEANIHAKGTSIHATGQAEDMYAAIDTMTAKLDRQVLRHKEKLTNHHQAQGGIKTYANEIPGDSAESAAA